MNTRAKKSLGQNFLNAPSVVRKMIDSSEVSSGDCVVEVGPGKGVLTKELLDRGAQVIAYELDLRMIEYLKESLSVYVESGQLELVHEDILESDLSRFKSLDYKLIANIPYYITNAIIRLFLESKLQPKSMCLLVQKEVAERIARDKKESILSLSVKAFGKVKYLVKVPRRYFSPKPKVDSAVILISDISRGNFTSEAHEERFFYLVKRGFAHKRKQLASNLASQELTKEAWQKEFLNLGYLFTVRAEELNLQDWLLLSK